MKITVILTLIAFGIIGITQGQEQGADADIDHVDANTVIVPITNKLNDDEKPQPVYSLFSNPNFDGQKIYEDVKAKMNDVVQKFSAQVPAEVSEVFQLKKSPSLRKSTDETPTTFSNLYNSIPNLNLDYLYENIDNTIPDMNAIVSNIRDTANNIDFTPVKAAGQDILAVLPTLAIISFYGLVAYFFLALLFRVAGFALATKINTLRLASDVFMQAPEFVSRMMASDTTGLDNLQQEELARSDTSSGNVNLMNLLRGAQKVSEALDKYSELNQS